MTQSKKNTLKACAVASLVFVAAGPVQADNWRYAMEEGLTDPQGLYATKFKEEIEANSDHTVQIYAVGSLGESADAMEQAQAGLLQFIDQSPGFTGALIPEAEAFLVPYIQPTDPEVVRKFFKEGVAVNEMFHDIYREQGLELLSVFPEGEMVVTTMEEFRNPEDLAGMKIRTMTSPLLLETYTAFGASPIAMAWGELIGGLKTKMVDGQENPTIWIEAYDLDNLTNVMTYTGHGQYTTAVMANADFYDGLSDADKELVQNASQAALDYILDVAVELDAIGLAKIKESNPDYIINRLTEDERAVFKERAIAVEEAFVERAGERGAAILEQMKVDLIAAQQ
jgi:TRAP-type C4-dicarboxylate transport system substrate-binding protein|tara:strand:+ start:111 stop:1130 length:1020 start_codon:yes stop_codon:yes gene_type:complete